MRGPRERAVLQDAVEEIRAIRLSSTADADEIAFAYWLAGVLSVPVVFEFGR